jgi:hypothetical protein
MKNIVLKGGSCKKMNKKGNAIGVTLIVLMSIIAVFVVGGGIYLFTRDAGTQSGVGGSTVDNIVTQTQTGDVAQIKVYVRDLANNNINTKLAVAVYCQDDDGKFIIDATSSSTSAEISGSTTRGKTVTCWAFNSTVQTKTPVSIAVDEEVEHVVVDAYSLATTGAVSFYNDQYQTGTGGVINVTSVSADGTGTLAKMRFKNNNTDKWLPAGGVYFSTVSSSNVSEIDLTGSATLSGLDHSSTQIVDSSLSTAVSTRKDNWDYVFEFDDNSAESGNQPVILEENDYLESGSVKVTGDGDGCTSAGELVSSYGFTKGFFRGTKTDEVKYGAETDASSSAVISTDITGDTFYCKA